MRGTGHRTAKGATLWDLVDLAQRSLHGGPPVLPLNITVFLVGWWQLIINIAMVVIEQSPPGTQAKLNYQCAPMWQTTADFL